MSGTVLPYCSYTTAPLHDALVRGCMTYEKGTDEARKKTDKKATDGEIGIDYGSVKPRRCRGCPSQ